jgi:glycosyltransferase involved in cell wall biosynthesis
MISILIPTYNFDCVPLAEKIQRMAKRLGIPYEIVVADDASFPGFRERNGYVGTWKECRYLQIERNAGPAVVRNYLADNAQYSYMLFLDADTMPVNDDFLERYLEYAKPYTIVCGGFIYRRDITLIGSELRYRYGIEVEERTPAERSELPYNNFISMNFMIYRETFMKIRFDESFHLGYEDTMFGIRAKSIAAEIHHIDNPVYHNVEEKSDAYLDKTKRAIRNLLGHEDEMTNHVKLLQWYEKAKRMGITASLAKLFKRMEPLFEKNLTSKTPSLHIFALYKLSYLCYLREETQQ